MTSGHTLTTEKTDARVQVIVDGEVLADTTGAVLLSETGLPGRYYLPRADVRMDLLTPTDTGSHCPFKGDAVYWTATVGDRELVDLAWSYPTPIPGREDITELVCFFNEKVAITVDGESLERPVTQWSESPEPTPHPVV